ncbi:hypothetical protein [Streptomyces avermitilis]|uniref:hypothetical protein n=1 Tax=Streptomyces avermitilis TaxID=33903 RepID=UPI003719E23A
MCSARISSALSRPAARAASHVQRGDGRYGPELTVIAHDLATTPQQVLDRAQHIVAVRTARPR